MRPWLMDAVPSALRVTACALRCQEPFAPNQWILLMVSRRDQQTPLVLLGKRSNRGDDSVAPTVVAPVAVGFNQDSDTAVWQDSDTAVWLSHAD